MDIEQASRDTPPYDWKIRCDNHSEGFKPLMKYSLVHDAFICQFSWQAAPCDTVTAQFIDDKLPAKVKDAPCY
jgi:hypothetical protein